MNPLTLSAPIVTAEWLHQHLAHPNLVILDATLAPPGKTPLNLNLAVQIPRTQIFDFDKKICDQNSSLPHMMPSPEFFTREVQALGINRNSVIVVYDRVGIFSSPRARWMFKAMGHDAVAVLDGGLPAWLTENRPVEKSRTELTPEKSGTELTLERSLSATPVSGDFVAKPRSELFCDKVAVEKAIASKNLILDARSAGRFQGREPEPRPGLKSGHIPTSKNLPFSEVLDGFHLRSPQELKRKFEALTDTAVEKLTAAPTEKPIVFSCGSGVSACVIALAAEISGYKNISVYDGSWTEWGRL